MRVRLLGPVDVVDDHGTEMPIGSPTQRLVLAVLGSRGGEVVPPARLVEAIWGEAPPPSAEASLRSYISRLRRVLGAALPSQPGGWSLRLHPGHLDLDEFERLVTASRAEEEPLAALSLIDAALALWRGPAFGEFVDEPVLRPVAVRLTEARLAAVEARAALLLGAGRAADAVGAAEELLAERPWREDVWVTLVTALCATGRVVEAVDAYRRAHAALADVGMEPGPRLRAAQQAALAPATSPPKFAPAAPASPPSPPPPPPPPSWVPPPLPVPTWSADAASSGTRAATSSHPVAPGRGRPPRRPISTLFGRDSDLAAVADLLRTARIVTLLGPGGVGKTRLALDLADRVADRFADGVRFVELTKVANGAGVGAFVADALGVRLRNGDVDAALRVAAGMDVLVLLDNCEHVVAQAAEAATVLLEHGDGVRVLATSRELLGVDGEHSWPVRPLRVEGPDAPAHGLFWTRVRAASPDVKPDEVDLAAAERIVRRLDGLPLAIEMAAARVAAMSPVELAQRLDEHLGLLRDNRRTTDRRHRTLTEVVAWSVSLLDDDARTMLRVVAAFTGQVVAADAAALAGFPEAETLDRIEALAARSLLVVDTTRRPARYGLLEIIREYAREHIPTGDSCLSREHARLVLRELRRADAALRTDREAEASQRIVDLLPETRAAQAWAVTQAPGLAVDIGAALHLFAMSRLRLEPVRAALNLVHQLGLHLVDADQQAEVRTAGVPAAEVRTAGVPAAGDGGDVRLPPGVGRGAAATLLATAAAWYIGAGELARAESYARLGCRIAGDLPERRFPLELLSDIASYTGRTEEAVAHGWDTTEAGRAAGDTYAEVAGLLNVALAHAYAGDVAAGRVALAEGPTAAPLAPTCAAWLAYAEAELILDEDPDRCLDLLDRVIALADSVDNLFVAGVARVSAVSVRARCGDPALAVTAFVDVLRHWLDRGGLTHLLTALRNLVILFQRMEHPRAAAQLLGAVTSRAVKPSYGMEAELLADADAWVERSLGASEAARERARGAGRGVDAAARVALDHLAELNSVDPGAPASRW